MHKELAGAGLGLSLLAASVGRASGPEPVVPQPMPPQPVRPLEGYWQPGGYEARVGSPYYYGAPGFPTAVAAPAGGVGADGTDCDCRRGAPAPPSAPLPVQPVPAAAEGMPVEPPVTVYNFPYQPLPGDPYTYHFGPGFYRRAEYGHYRFPYYTYRAPWYFPGHAVYNRDTNFPW